MTVLGRMRLDELPDEVRTRAGMRALALAGSGTKGDARDVEAFANAIAKGDGLGYYVYRYVDQKVALPEGLLWAALVARLGEQEAGRMAESITAVAWSEGRTEGRIETLARRLLNWAGKRFGKVDRKHEEVIRTAAPEQLEAWDDRLQGAPDLDFVLWTDAGRRAVDGMALPLACALTERVGGGPVHGGNLEADIRRLLADAAQANDVDGAAVESRAWMIAARRAEAYLRTDAAGQVFGTEDAKERARFETPFLGRTRSGSGSGSRPSATGWRNSGRKGRRRSRWNWWSPGRRCSPRAATGNRCPRLSPRRWRTGRWSGPRRSSARTGRPLWKAFRRDGHRRTPRTGTACTGTSSGRSPRRRSGRWPKDGERKSGTSRRRLTAAPWRRPSGTFWAM